MEVGRARHRRRNLIVAIAIAIIAVMVPALAFAHIERASYWPDPAPDKSVKPAAGGSIPAVRKVSKALKKSLPGKTRVVCQQVPSKKLRKHGTTKQLSKNKSIKALNKDLKAAKTTGYTLRASQPPIRISKKKAKNVRKTNIKLLRMCRYNNIQDAVTASHNNDSVEIMPGLYTEPKSRARPTNDPACANLKITNDKNQAGAVSYAYQFKCPNDQNLIAVMGRALTNVPVPQPPRLDRHGIPDAGKCIRCNVQIQGTGMSPDAVTIDAGRVESGDGGPIDSVKDVGIRADRADGIVIDNLKVRHAKEHDIYVIETDGSHLDRFKVPYAGEYGLLTFVADHSLIENCDGWGAGDSALYPGASADTGEALPPSQRRYGTELRNCDMHHSTLGYSGTDGNSVWVHNNNFYDNTEGFSTDVFTAPGHPGFPQDSDLVENNNFCSNNFNPYLPQCGRGPAARAAGARTVAAESRRELLRRRPVRARARRQWSFGSRAATRTWSATTTSGTTGAAARCCSQVPDQFVCDDPNNQVAGCDPTAPVPGDLLPQPVLREQDGPDARRQPCPERQSTSGGTRAASPSTPRRTPITVGSTTPAPTARPRASPAPTTAAPTCRPTATTAPPSAVPRRSPSF